MITTDLNAICDSLNLKGFKDAWIIMLIEAQIIIYLIRCFECGLDKCNPNIQIEFNF